MIRDLGGSRLIKTFDFQQNKDEQWQRAMEYVSLVSELNYMTQVVIMLYEDPTKDATSDERFHVELHFSPGVNCVVEKDVPEGPGFRPHSRNHEAREGQQQRQQPPNSEADAKGPGDCGDCGNSDPASVPSANVPGNTQEDAAAPKPATVVCAFKCSSENVSKMLDAVGNLGHRTDEEGNDSDNDDGGEIEASDAALEEAVYDEKAAEVSQSDPIPIRRTRSKESCPDCGVEQEVCNINFLWIF